MDDKNNGQKIIFDFDDFDDFDYTFESKENEKVEKIVDETFKKAQEKKTPASEDELKRAYARSTNKSVTRDVRSNKKVKVGAIVAGVIIGASIVFGSFKIISDDYKEYRKMSDAMSYVTILSLSSRDEDRLKRINQSGNFESSNLLNEFTKFKYNYDSNTDSEYKVEWYEISDMAERMCRLDYLKASNNYSAFNICLYCMYDFMGSRRDNAYDNFRKLIVSISSRVSSPNSKYYDPNHPCFECESLDDYIKKNGYVDLKDWKNKSVKEINDNLPELSADCREFVSKKTGYTRK